jgi:hypothetical protein
VKTIAVTVTQPVSLLSATKIFENLKIFYTHKNIARCHLRKDGSSLT